MSILEIDDLVMEYRTGARRVRSLDGAALTVEAGEIAALVGESGSGKSTLAAAIGQLPVRGLHRLSGRLHVEGHEVFGLGREPLSRLRRECIGYVFQDPVAALDPTMKIGAQVALASGTDRHAAVEVLSGLDLRDVERVLRSYPHEISGGMAQRVAIGMTLARKPRLIVADEPTAALDASIKAQVLELLVDACRKAGTALLLVTHDLHIVRQYADRVAVMYGGRVVEHGPAADVLGHPAHPYTAALLRSAVGRELAGERVEPIPGMPPYLSGRAEACTFASRCRHATERCRSERPEVYELQAHLAICHYSDRSITGENTA